MSLKRSILLLLICLSPFAAMAQPYKSMFGKDSTSWASVYYWHTGFGQKAFMGDVARTVKDTVINSQTYKLIKMTSYPYSTTWIREDTMTGKVWAGDQLIFDFALQPGDTFNTGRLFQSNKDGIDTVESVSVINGRRHIYFKHNYPVWGHRFTFIEGIGCSRGIILGHPALISAYLMCAYQDGQKTDYVNTMYNGNCYAPNGGPLDITDLSAEDKPLVYPNPATDKIHIRKPGIIEARLVATDGRLVKQTAGQSLTAIDVSGIPSGIYILRLVAADGSIDAQTVKVER